MHSPSTTQHICLAFNITYIDGDPLHLSRWPKINSVHPLGNMKTNLKSEVDWGNSSQDITFTRYILPLRVNTFQKVNGGHIDLSRWFKINSIHPLGNMKTELLKSIA